MKPNQTTAVRNEHCPSRDELSALLEGSLDDPTESSISRHLDACADCRQALEETAGERSWWVEVQSFLPPAPFSKLPSSASELTTRANDGKTANALREGEVTAEICKWLGPTDDPQSMGRIGRYEVTGVVGAGSMGVVLKAHETQLKRYVAIKVLFPLLAHNGAARRRFSREARSAAAVSHPHVVPIYGVDEYRGLPYLVMQYISGQSLAERIAREGPLSAEEVVRIALQTARALSAAHEQGLVHRDIKPANILLENGIERALVTDFGLARIADDASITGSGVITGTPQFMSPEQASGHNVDARSDLFSLGATMYAMCTGHPPFRAATVFGLLKRICEDEPRLVRASNPDIPEWLDQLIGKLLSKDPSDRFDSATEVARCLTEELAHLQNPMGARIPARPWLTRRGLFKRVRYTHTIAAIAASVLAVSVWLPRHLAAPDPGERTGGIPIGRAESAWFSADMPLQQVTAEVERLERQLGSYPPAPGVDPWAAEIDYLDRAITRLEEDDHASTSLLLSDPAGK